jgi:Uma2 family endonuclease
MSNAEVDISKDKIYTYEDYLTWGDDVRCELIDGVPYMMSSPTDNHQRVILSFSNLLYNYLKGKPCEVFIAPFNVRLKIKNNKDKKDTVVQPDIFVVCNKSKIRLSYVMGAPDMVIEILSPSNPGHDMVTKLLLYQNSGVREYWIINPETKAVSVCTLENEKYIVSNYINIETIPVTILDGLKINLSEVFADLI